MRCAHLHKGHNTGSATSERQHPMGGPCKDSAEAVLSGQSKRDHLIGIKVHSYHWPCSVMRCEPHVLCVRWDTIHKSHLPVDKNIRPTIIVCADRLPRIARLPNVKNNNTFRSVGGKVQLPSGRRNGPSMVRIVRTTYWGVGGPWYLMKSIARCVEIQKHIGCERDQKQTVVAFFVDHASKSGSGGCKATRKVVKIEHRGSVHIYSNDAFGIKWSEE